MCGSSGIQAPPGIATQGANATQSTTAPKGAPDAIAGASGKGAVEQVSQSASQIGGGPGGALGGAALATGDMS
ncbi:MAG: hypothetical protein H7123_05080, partial [Thermoleophilia bacterium]|nr:hypothetical protein [Thermoleophilia bacterium]